ncbi:MAG: sulfite exporter TauE/SafE family protein [Ignavibacteriaceae bacterium]
MEILSGFIIGFLGSLHCIGMCGPIAFALPVPNTSTFSFITGRVLYNIGRVITYTLIGLFFGFIGQGIAVAGFQQVLSITLGVVILLSFLLPRKYKTKVTGSQFINKITSPLRASIGKLFKQKTLSSFFLIGILNGFLPCGFVYIGVAGAVALGNVLSGALFMMLFGLGTMPVMLAATLFSKFINLDIRRKISKAIPVFAVVMAVIFILRGMNLGIPFISPKLPVQSAEHSESSH